MEFLNEKAVWPGWKTVRIIGRGSYGAVYEIQRDVLGETEKAALKVITIPQNDSDITEMRSDGYDDESITDTFNAHLKNIVSEYSLMRKLNGSANVVNCDDVRYVQHDDGFGWDIYIKMELLTPLAAAIPAVLPEEQTVKIAKDLCRALVQCRRFDIVHRDIKPQNIFVSPLGDYKLGDFGIAKTMEKTSGGTKIGTYKYMAPEVYNNQPYGQGADIYSLGLVLYWLMNERRMPFLPLPPEKLSAGMEEEARLRRFRGEPIPAPAHGSAELKRIVLKACAFEPKDRYQTAENMLLDLERLERGTGNVVSFAPTELLDAEKEEETMLAPEEEETMLAPEEEETVLAPEEEETVLAPEEEIPMPAEMAPAPFAPEPEEGTDVYPYDSPEASKPVPLQPENDGSGGAVQKPETMPEMKQVAPAPEKKKKTGLIAGSIAGLAFLALVLVLVFVSKGNAAKNGTAAGVSGADPAPDDTTSAVTSDSYGTYEEPDASGETNSTPQNAVAAIPQVEILYGGDSSVWRDDVEAEFNQEISMLSAVPSFNLEIALQNYPGWGGVVYCGTRDNSGTAYGNYTLELQGDVGVGDYQFTHYKVDNNTHYDICVVNFVLHVTESDCSVSDITFTGDAGVYTNYTVKAVRYGSKIQLHFIYEDSTLFDYANYPNLVHDLIFCEGHLYFEYNNTEDKYWYQIMDAVPDDGFVIEFTEYTPSDQKVFSTLTVLLR